MNPALPASSSSFAALRRALRLVLAVGLAALALGSAARAEDALLYGLHSAGNIVRHNGATAAAELTLATGLSGAHDIARTPQGDLLVALAAGNKVAKYNGSTGAVISAGLFTVTSPAAIAVGHDGAIYVANGARVSKYGPYGTLLAADFITGLNNPVDLEIDYQGETLYIAQKGANAISRHDLSDGSTLDAALVSITAPNAVALSRSGALYVAAGSAVTRYSLPTTTADPAFSLVGLASPSRLAIGNNSNRLYVGLSSGVARVASYNLATGAAINAALLAGAAGPHALALRESGAQSIYFPKPADIFINASDARLHATSTSGLPVRFELVSGGDYVSLPTDSDALNPNTLLLPKAVGSVTVRAIQEGDAHFSAATAVEQTFAITKVPQTISFPAISGLTTGATPTLIEATASSGLPVSFTLVSGSATLNGNLLQPSAGGDIVIRVTQPGDDTYLAAPAVEQTISVGKQAQTIAFAAPSDRLFGAAPFSVSASSSSGLPVAIAVTSGPAAIQGKIVTVTGSGTVELTATQAGDAAYAAAAPVVVTFQVSAGAQTITFPAQVLSFGGAPVTLSASSDAGLPVAYTLISGPGSLVGDKLSATGVGDIVVQADQPGTASVAAAAPVQTTFTVGPKGNVINFPAIDDITYGSGNVTLAATATSGLPVSYQIVSGPASVFGSTLVPSAAGVVTVRARQLGGFGVAAAVSIERTFTIAKAAQTIAFPQPFNTTFGGADLVLTATSDSGLPVAYSLDSGVATLSGETLIPGAAGEIVIRASQPGNAAYLPAEAVVRTITVAKAAQTIAFEPVANRTFSDVPVALGAAASSGLPVGYEIVSGPATLTDGYLTFVGAGSVTVRVTQPGDDNFLAASAVERTITVAKAPQTIAFAAPADRLFTDGAFTLSASSDSGLPVSFVLVSGPATLDGATLTPTGTGTVIVRATQAGDDHYLAAGDAQRSFRIAAAAQTIDFAELEPATFGDAPRTLSATASSGLAVTFSLVSGPATLHGNTLALTGAGTIVVRASQRGNATYRAAEPVERSLVVAKAPQTIDFTALEDRLFGPDATALSATASSGLPVSFAVVEGPGALSASGVTPTGVGTVVVEATQAGGADHLAAAPVRRQFAVAAAPAQVTLGNLARTYTGSALAATVATEPAGLSVELGYRPAATPEAEPSTVPPTRAGSYLVTATVTTEGSIGSATGTLVIAKAPLTVTAVDAVKLAGTANPALTFTYAGFLGADDESAVTAPPVPATAAGTSSPVGQYPITLSGGAAADYSFINHVPGVLRVVTFSGPYETLLHAPIGDDERLPVGLLEINVPSTGAAFTGRLTLAGEPSALAFKGNLVLSEAEGSALATVALVGRPSTNRYTLALTVGATGVSATVRKAETLIASSAVFDATQLFVAAANRPAPWAGAHTFLLDAPRPLVGQPEGVSLPLGSAAAAASIGVDGVLRLSGRLPDGTALTGTARAGVDGSFRVFIKPYGTRLDSFLAGRLALALHPDLNNRYTSAKGSRFVWQKAANARDALYRAGIPALEFRRVELDPWQPPAKATALQPAIVLADRLGLDAESIVQLDFDLPAPTATALPEVAALTEANRVVPANAAVLAWSLAVTPANGLFSGKVTFRDVSAGKTVARVVTIYGVLRQPTHEELAEGEAFLGAAQLRIPGLSGALPTSGALRLYTLPAVNED